MADFQKQKVQWFPGHMAKTRRQIKEMLPLVDGVVELLDARVPYSSANPELDTLVRGKPRIVLLNKCDVADPAATKRWIAAFEAQGKTALAVDCRSGKGLSAFLPTVQQVLKKTIEKNTQRGMAGKPLRLMVVGIPNTGKSSFINRMAGKNRAKVADKAGVTRQNQWFAVGGGIELHEYMQGWEILEAIGRKRGFLMRGGEIDYNRSAVIVADEFRGGKLGRMTLELPE